jgi:hypothetical protein
MEAQVDSRPRSSAMSARAAGVSIGSRGGGAEDGVGAVEVGEEGKVGGVVVHMGVCAGASDAGLSGDGGAEASSISSASV